LEGKPEGFSFIEFDITKTGLVEKIFVLKCLETSLVQAAIVAVNQIPTKIPSRHKGEVVKVRYKILFDSAKKLTKSKSR